MPQARKSGVSFDELSGRRQPFTVRDLTGLELTLEYSDVDGQETRRAVRVIQFQGDALFCRCHLRRADRTFRIDRIKTVIDQNGEVLPAAEFFNLFGMAVVPSRPVPPAQTGQPANAAAGRGFGALAATEARLSNNGGKRPPRKLTKTKLAMMLALLIVLIALAI